jgi:O-antigen/teichoic acid export membrane protein
VFGPKYEDSILVLQILFVYVPIRFIGSVSTILANSIHLEKKIVTITLVSVIINIGLNIIVIPYYGAIGAAFATLVSGTIGTIWSTTLALWELRNASSEKSLMKMRQRLDQVR